MDFQSLITFVDLAGVAVFAATGGLVASRKELDVIGFALMATLTGVGGGTVRDLLLSRPVFWINDPNYLMVCFSVALFTYFFAHRLQKRYAVLIWGDAIGLAVFGVMGAHIALESGAPLLLSIVLGVMTATFGGLIRDVVAGETSFLLKPEVYVTAALVSAASYIGLLQIGVNVLVSVGLSIVAGFLVRSGGILWGWVLPRYKNRAGRDYSE
ncbi:MAG: trimeric intracellular cation channel family protein [Sneathiella sp.]